MALEDSTNHVSAFVTLDLSFQHVASGAALTATTNRNKVCVWNQPPTCLPDGTGILLCAADEMSLQVVDCPAGPPALRCVGGGDAGVAECVCPNRCALEAKTCGRDSCGHDCGSCAVGSECDPLGNCRPRSKSGCADGTREAFVDSAVYPTIAGCEVWWTGAQSLRTPRSSQEWCGNSTGIACKVPADGCAPGWHMCMRSGWPADLRERAVNNGGGPDGGASTLNGSICYGAAYGHSFMAASSSAYPGGGSCTAPPFGCYDTDVAGYIDTVACGNTTNSDSCNNAVWQGATRGVGPFCGSYSIARSDQNGVLCCQDPEITGS